MIYVVLIIFLFNYQYSLLICVGNLKCNAVTGSGCTKILSNKTNCQLSSYCITKRSPELMPCISFRDFKMKLLVVITKPHKTKALLEVWDFVCLFCFFFRVGGLWWTFLYIMFASSTKTEYKGQRKPVVIIPTWLPSFHFTPLYQCNANLERPNAEVTDDRQFQDGRVTSALANSLSILAHYLWRKRCKGWVINRQEKFLCPIKNEPSISILICNSERL